MSNLLIVVCIFNEVEKQNLKKKLLCYKTRTTTTKSSLWRFGYKDGSNDTTLSEIG